MAENTFELLYRLSVIRAYGGSAESALEWAVRDKEMTAARASDLLARLNRIDGK